MSAESLALLLAATSVNACTCRPKHSSGDRQGPAVVLVDPEELGGAEQREIEPNDDPARAQPLSVGEPIVGALACGRAACADVDWYAVRVDTEDQVVRAELSGIAGVDARIEVFASSGRWLVKVDNGGPGAGEVLSGVSADSEVILLKISGRPEPTGKDDFDGAYRIAVSTRPRELGEEREPNWKEELATAIGVEGEAAGSCGWRSDEDWYRFELPHGAGPRVLRAEVDAPDGVSPSVGLRAAGQWIAEPRVVAAGEALAVDNVRLPPADAVYLVLRCGRAFDLDSRYHVRVSVGAAPEVEHEAASDPDSQEMGRHHGAVPAPTPSEPNPLGPLP